MKLTRANREKALRYFSAQQENVQNNIAKQVPESCQSYILGEWWNMRSLLASDSVVYQSQFQSRFDNWKANVQLAKEGYFKSIEPFGENWKFVHA